MEWGMWEEQLFKESTVIGERDQRAPMRKLKTTGNHQRYGSRAQQSEWREFHVNNC
jgi:hypothetical protein